MRLYIAGPMTGLPNHNREAFAQAEITLRSQGFDEILSPTSIPVDTWQVCMKQAITMMLQADAVVLLPGWERSEGATVEAQIAECVGIPRFYLDPGCFSREQAARIRATLS